eukprot:3851540-Amphidinium_carterae.1
MRGSPLARSTNNASSPVTVMPSTGTRGSTERSSCSDSRASKRLIWTPAPENKPFANAFMSSM